LRRSYWLRLEFKQPSSSYRGQCKFNFDESNSFPKAEKYIVKLKDDGGNSFILDEISPGTYSYNINELLTGKTYELSVEGEGKSFSSKSTLQDQVNFDSLIVIKNITNTTGPGSGKKGFNYEIKVRYSDPAGIKNFYRFVLFANGIQSENNYIFDDRLTDGKNIETPLLGMNNKFEPGDTILIDMQCIDNNVYEYFKGFGTTFGKFQPSSTPANPPTNILGAKLGYFNVHTSQIRTYILP